MKRNSAYSLELVQRMCLKAEPGRQSAIRAGDKEKKAKGELWHKRGVSVLL